MSLVAYGMPVSLALVSVIYGAAYGMFPDRLDSSSSSIMRTGWQSIPASSEIIKELGWRAD